MCANRRAVEASLEKSFLLSGKRALMLCTATPGFTFVLPICTRLLLVIDSTYVIFLQREVVNKVTSIVMNKE